MPITIKQRIEAEGITTSDATVLNVQLDDSAADVIAMLPESCLWEVQEELSDSGSGCDVSDVIFLRAHKEGIKAAEVQSYSRELRASGKDYAATKSSPVYYRKGGKVHILPDGGTVVGVSIPDVTHSDNTITGWPRDFVRLVSLHAALKLKERDIRAEKDDLPDLLTQGTLPTVPTAPSFSYVDAVAASIASTSIGSPGTAPTYSGPSVSLTAVPSISDLDLETELDGVTALTAPSVPSALTTGVTPPTAPAAPTIAFTDAAASTVTQTSIAALPTAPAYSKPTINANYSTALSAFDTRMGDDDVELAVAELQKARNFVEQLNTDIQNNLAEFRRDVSEYEAGVQKVLQQAQLDQQRLLDDAARADNIAIQNEIETARAAIADYEAELGLFAQEISNYRAQVEEAVTEYRANLERFSQELGLYQSKIQAKVQEYQQNVAKTAQLSDLERRGELEQYGQDLRKSLDDFNSEFATYEASLRKEIEQARLTQQELIAEAQLSTDVSKQNEIQTLAAAVQEYEAQLNRYSQELGSYRAEVERHATVFQAAIERFKTRVTTLRAEYSDLKNRFAEMLATYIDNHRSTLSYDIRLYEV